MSGSVLPLVVYFKSECWEVLSEYWSTLPLIKNSSFITILTCGQIESTDVSGSSWVNWKKKLNLGDPLQSTTSHLRQSSKSSFLLDLPPSASISSACNFLFCTPSAGQEDESAPHHGHPRHPAPLLKQRLGTGEGWNGFARKRNWKLARSLWYLWGIHPTERKACPWIFRPKLKHFCNDSLYTRAVFKAAPISFVDRTAWMLIGFVLTLARRKVQCNADAGGEMGKEEELGELQTKHGENFGSFCPLGPGEANNCSGKRVMRRHSHHGFGLRLYFQRLNLHRIWLKKTDSHSFKGGEPLPMKK